MICFLGLNRLYFRVPWCSCTWILMFFTKLGKFSVIISSNIFSASLFSLLLLICYTIMYVLLFLRESCINLRLCSFFFILCSLNCIICWSFLTFILYSVYQIYQYYCALAVNFSLLIIVLLNSRVFAWMFSF